CEDVGLTADGQAYFLSEVEDMTGASTSTAADFDGTPLSHEVTLDELMSDCDFQYSLGAVTDHDSD
ncbi:hypothetical protein Dimus_026503, partial [Dionaea muscipula]